MDVFNDISSELSSRLKGRTSDAFLVILGSGMSRSFAEEEYEVIGALSNRDLDGHPGKVGLWWHKEIPVILSLGRDHLYEGSSTEQVVSLIDCVALLGLRRLILTNAAGGLHPLLQTGDLMMQTGYLTTLAGSKRLRRGNLSYRHPEGTFVFSDRSSSLMPHLITSVQAEALKRGVVLKEGTYAGVLGPSYETSAEIRMLRYMRGNAVGMSTITEVEAAFSNGMDVMGFSLITNVLSDTNQKVVTHDEVTEAASAAQSRIRSVIEVAINVMGVNPSREGVRE